MTAGRELAAAGSVGASGRVRSSIRAAMGLVVLAAAASLAGALSPLGAVPVATGSWAPAPPPSRTVVKAVQLANGKVMAVVNDTLCPRAACFEMYDPRRGAWEPLPPLVPAGELHSPVVTLTSLGHDDHALVLFDGARNPAGPQRYRYHAGKWVALPPVNPTTDYVRTKGFTATLLEGGPGKCGAHCGKVLIAGGGNPDAHIAYRTTRDGDVRRSAYLYGYDRDNAGDPGNLQLAAFMDGRPGHIDGGAVQLADGRVLVVGGIFNEQGNEQGVSADIWDPTKGPAGAWSPAADLPSWQWRPWAVRLHDGRVLVAGDSDHNPVLFDPTGVTVDPATGEQREGKWTTVDPCRDENGEPVQCGVGAVLPDGRVLAVEEISLTPARRAWIFDPASVGDAGTPDWTAANPPGAAYTATLLDGGAALDRSGSTELCGSNCGSVLAAGGVVPTGAAQLFQLLKVEAVVEKEGPACGGKIVTVSGRGFHDVATVNFGTEKVHRASADNPGGFSVENNGTAITVKAPRNAPGTVPVTVTTAGGATSAPNPDAVFTYAPVPPATIRSLSPPEGRAAGGTEVTVEGGFVPECVRSVRFGGQDASWALDPAAPGARLTATSPGGDPGQQVQVSVGVDPGPPAPDDGVGVPSVAESPGADVFTYFALPAISALDPPRDPAFGGTKVTVAGTGFEAGATEVRFGDVAATDVAVASPTRLTATVPAHDPGRVQVTVTTAERGTSAPFDSFTYHPGISGLFPPSGPLTGDTVVTIVGRGFTGAQAVRFGAASVAPVSLSDTEIVVRTPAHPLPEAVPVALTASGLNSLPEDVLFTYGLAGTAGPGGGGAEPAAGPPRQDTAPPEAAPPGGTGSPTPSPAQAPSALNAPASSPAPAPAPAPSPSPGPAPVPAPSPVLAPGQAPLAGQAPTQAASPAALAPPAPAPGAAPAPAQAAPGSGQAGAGSDEREQPKGSTRHAMADAQVGLGLAGAAGAACFSWMALTGRVPSRRRRHADAIRTSRTY